MGEWKDFTKNGIRQGEPWIKPMETRSKPDPFVKEPFLFECIAILAFGAMIWALINSYSAPIHRLLGFFGVVRVFLWPVLEIMCFFSHLICDQIFMSFFPSKRSWFLPLLFPFGLKKKNEWNLKIACFSLKDLRCSSQSSYLKDFGFSCQNFLLQDLRCSSQFFLLMDLRLRYYFFSTEGFEIKT